MIDVSTAARPTGLPEVDRVLGGGFVPGSVTLVGGEPGIGKSTLLLQLVGATAAAGVTSLYVSGEESAGQVRSRADRLGAVQDALWLVSETALPHIMTHIEKVQPEIVVIDSIQTLHDPNLGSAPGSVAQVRECANRLVTHAKAHGTTVLLVGHVTKEGTLAGPRCSSMWSTRCSSSTAIVTTVCGFCVPRSTALAPPPKSGSCRWISPALSPSRIRAGCSWRIGSPACRVRRSSPPSMAIGRS